MIMAGRNRLADVVGIDGKTDGDSLVTVKERNGDLWAFWESEFEWDARLEMFTIKLKPSKRYRGNSNE